MVIITNAYPFLVFLRMLTPSWCFYECLPLSGVFTNAYPFLVFLQKKLYLNISIELTFLLF